MKSMINAKYQLSLLLSFTIFASCSPEENRNNCLNQVTISVNAYSFVDLLSAKNPRNNEQVYTYFNLLDWCASKNIKALDATGYFFPTYPEVPSDEYLEKFKKKADALGIVISGTGIRNDFASPDSLVRRQGIELAKAWIVASAKLEAPMIRLFAGHVPEGYEDKWEELLTWMVPCFQECAVFAEQHNVKIGIQNHADVLQTADQCIRLLEAIGSDRVGLMLDIGSFTTEDPYLDIEKVTPYAISWQIKESPYGTGGQRTDFEKLVKIIYDKGYSGYLPVESLMVRGQSYDPFERVEKIIYEMNTAIANQCAGK